MKTVRAIIKNSNIDGKSIERKAYYPLVFLLAFVSSNAQVLGTLSPFPAALIAALPYGLCLSAFFGSVLGYIIFGGMVNNLSCFIAAVGVLTVKFCLAATSAAFKKIRANVFVNCAVSLVVVL